MRSRTLKKQIKLFCQEVVINTNLVERLKRVEAEAYSIEAIVEFFQIISPIQDSGRVSVLAETIEKNQKKVPQTVADAIRRLEKSVQRCGRNPYGMNRTEKGVEVNYDNVWLGDVYGLWTFPASYWLAHEKELKGHMRPELGSQVTDWHCIMAQCYYFVTGNVPLMLEDIKVIMDYAFS
ncbi:hypothetical protein KBI31_00775 [Patescibacteria group bacterium]|jgi:hypothetical protein|nr:hypothetical protein [Patescibacteria group bacterium]